MTASGGWLPPLVCLEDCNGNWTLYLNAVYGHFRNDFVKSCPSVEGRRCGIMRTPITDGKEATFWHIISEGKIESERVPDLRRCERIRWPRPIIEAMGSTRVCCWRRDAGQPRILLALPDFSYLVVLKDLGNYVLLLTAYCVEPGHHRRKLAKECADYTMPRKG